MTSASFRAALLGAALLVSAASSAVEADADALIARLARPAPSSVAFAEVRFSSLLAEPIVVSGELHYGGPASLDRRVLQPYVETTAIRGDSVRVERAGEQPRSFALRRAPELRGLAIGLSAMLAGDVAAVRREFTVTASGDDSEWTVILVPLDDGAQRRLRQIVVTGAGAEPHCFAMLGARDGASVMLLGPAAAAPLAAGLTLEYLLDHCRAE
jgi:outer membrane lipoprotein carrier protein LolA